MYIDASLQALVLINIAYRSRQDQTSLCWLTNYFLANIVALTLLPLTLLNIAHCLAVFTFGDFYEFFSIKASENSM